MFSTVIAVLLMCVGIDVNINRWSVVRQTRQRTGDLTAYARAATFAGSSDAHGIASTAANLAEMTGATGSLKTTFNRNTDYASIGQSIAGHA